MRFRDFHAALYPLTSYRRAIPLLIAIALVVAVEPVLANKFETIGGGVSGSIQFKRDWLAKFFAIAGGVSLLSAILAVVVPHKNALFLNHANWKRSAVVLLIIAGALFAAAALV